jgi:hypothetical protein
MNEDLSYLVNIGSYEDWLNKVKELGGYFEQPDNVESFYYDCWHSGLTPQAVTDYLNEPIPE